MEISLPEFIAEIGDAEFSRRLNAPLRTVQSWRRRERMPRPAQAQEIIAIAKGRVTFETIYGAAKSPEGGNADGNR